MSLPTKSYEPTSILIPPSLSYFEIPPSQFLSENPQYTTLVVGACIFAPKHQDRHQRHPTASLPQYQDQDQHQDHSTATVSQHQDQHQDHPNAALPQHQKSDQDHPTAALPQHQEQDHPTAILHQHQKQKQDFPTATFPQPGGKQDKPTPVLVSAPAPRLLLVQRAATERAFPNLWEIPGGSTETFDRSILHSVAREVFEETGLHLTRIVRQVGEGVEFQSAKQITDENGLSKPRKSYLKLTFEIEVAEFEEKLAEGSGDPSTSLHHNSEPSSKPDDETPATQSTSVSAIPAADPSIALASLSLSSPSSPSFVSPPSNVITLNPEEHQRYIWVTEEEYSKRDAQNENKFKYDTMPGQQRETILKAFAQKIQKEKQKAKDNILRNSHYPKSPRDEYIRFGFDEARKVEKLGGFGE